MSAEPNDANEDLEVAGEEASGGSIPTDPELEAALREAAESIPDEGTGAAGGEPAATGENPGEGEPAIHLDEEIQAGLPPEAVLALRDNLAESSDRLLRLQADFDNFRKRALKERQEAVQYGHQNLFKDLLSVVDNLDRAIGHARESDGADLGSFLQGVELVRRELLGIFEKHHVSEIEALGKPFDPAFHEAMAQVESDEVPQGTVLEVLEKGYALRDRLVRPARVVVATAKPDTNG